MTRMVLAALFTMTALIACGDDDGEGTAATRLGVGDECAAAADCPPLEGRDAGLECLPFKGGYCGLTGCAGDDDCPTGSACVQHDGANYCFLECATKTDCNTRRAEDDEANCVGNAEFVDDRAGRKACVPPS